MRVGIRKRKREERPAAALRETVERQLAAAANAEPSGHNDPLYSVTETFQQSFQRIGRKRAGTEEQSGEPSEQERQEETRESSETEARDGKEKPERTATTSAEPEKRADAAPMRQFSKMAFERGELSAAVLQGTGKLALISCLKRAAGKSERSATLFGLGALTRNVPAHDPDQMMFHRNFANSAVGLVVDTLRDARRTVDSLVEMAMGVGDFRAEDGGATLHAIYPFLDDSRERALLEERRERLKGDCTPEERAILENAAVRAGALIAKKAWMKEEFIQKLREVSDRAAEALAELEAPETLEEAAQALSETETDAPTPPPSDETPPPASEETPDAVEETPPSASEEIPDAVDAQPPESSEKVSDPAE